MDNIELGGLVKGFKVDTSFALPRFESPDFSSGVDSLDQSRRERDGKEEAYQDAVLAALQGIESNTASLVTIVDLVRESNEHQEEVFGIPVEILSLTKVAGEEERKSTYRKLTGRFSKFEGDVATLAKMAALLHTVWSIVGPV